MNICPWSVPHMSHLILSNYVSSVHKWCNFFSGQTLACSWHHNSKKHIYIQRVQIIRAAVTKVKPRGELYCFAHMECKNSSINGVYSSSKCVALTTVKYSFLTAVCPSTARLTLYHCHSSSREFRGEGDRLQIFSFKKSSTQQQLSLLMFKSMSFVKKIVFVLLFLRRG